MRVWTKKQAKGLNTRTAAPPSSRSTRWKELTSPLPFPSSSFPSSFSPSFPSFPFSCSSHSFHVADLLMTLVFFHSRKRRRDRHNFISFCLSAFTSFRIVGALSGFSCLYLLFVLLFPTSTFFHVFSSAESINDTMNMIIFFPSEQLRYTRSSTSSSHFNMGRMNELHRGEDNCISSKTKPPNTSFIFIYTSLHMRNITLPPSFSNDRHFSKNSP